MTTDQDRLAKNISRYLYGVGAEKPDTLAVGLATFIAEPYLDAQMSALKRDYDILLDALREAVEIIQSLADQQAMPDDFYVEPLTYLKALTEKEEETT